MIVELKLLLLLFLLLLLLILLSMVAGVTLLHFFKKKVPYVPKMNGDEPEAHLI